MQKVNNDLSNIVVVLKYGTFCGVSRKKIIIEFSILFILCVCILTLAITMMTIDQIKNPDNLGIFVGALLSFILGFSFILIICLVIVIRNEKIRNEVLLWINDSVKTEAFVKTLDRKNWLGIAPLMKINVYFEIDGVSFIRTSEVEKQDIFNWGKPVGYFSGISKYVDRKVKILYSQKYDQVMILKD